MAGPRVSLVAVAVLAVSAACVDRLPSQDRRILVATPVAKMSIEDLAKDYQADQKAADSRYWGKAILVTGQVGKIRNEARPMALTFVDKSAVDIVEAELLDDGASAIVAGLGENRRITLKCYCAGGAGKVTLKSCVSP